MAKIAKIAKAQKNAFNQLISLYDVADHLENLGEDEQAKFMRKKLDEIGKYIVKQK